MVKQIVAIYFGLSIAPRIFTKVMKPVIATLRNIGHISANYIDDSLIGDTVNECIKNVQARCALMTYEFLGFVINTLEITVRLPTNKMSVVVNACHHLACKSDKFEHFIGSTSNRQTSLLFPCNAIRSAVLQQFRKGERRSAQETLWKFSRQNVLA